MRVCSEPGCPILVEKAGRCDTHRRQADKARGTRQARGYGAEHEAERRRLEPIVASGRTRCVRCRRLIRPDQDWVLDHNDDRTGYLGAAHDGCNAIAGGIASHRND